MEKKQLDNWDKTTAKRLAEVAADEAAEKRQIHAFGVDIEAFYLNKKYYVQLRNGACYRTR